MPDLAGLPWLSFNPTTQVLSGTPPTANAGLVVLPITVSDGNGGVFSGSIAIAPVNPGPTANDDSFGASEDAAAAVVGNAITNNDNDPVSLDVSGFFADPDASDVLSFSATGLPAGLSIDPNTGVISGTIDSSASVGSPYSVEVTANDGRGGSVAQTFAWNVANPLPLAVDDNFGASEDAAAAVVGNAITNNGSDPDGDALSAVVQTGVAGSNGGLFSIAANGEVTFDPNGQFEDLAAGETRATSFTYTLVDADGATDTATVTVTVTGQNDAPDAVGTIDDREADDSDSVTFDASGFFADRDNGAVLTFSAADLPPGLSIDLATGVISGTIDSSASVGGPYDVKVTATDEHGASLTRCFVWTVANPAPVAEDDALSMRQDQGAVIVGNALDNDSDPDGDALAAVPETGVAGSVGGRFSIDDAGNVTFDPGRDFAELRLGQTRLTSFTYTLVDADGATDTATVTVTVAGTNAPPKVGSGRIVVMAGSSGESLGLKAPVDRDGDRLSIRVTSLPRTGVLRLANGQAVKIGQKLTARQFEGLVYDAPFFHPGKGPILFRYSVSDGQYSTKGRVSIRVRTQSYLCCCADFPVYKASKASKASMHGLPKLSKTLAERAFEARRR